MTKLKVFIDFESVSSPFNSAAHLPKDFPYAYSIGVFAGKKFKTSTYIFNFNQEGFEEINQILRLQIIQDVRRLTNKRFFKINMDSTQFVSFAPVLERKILSKVYSGVEIYDIAMGYPISLSNATKQYLPDDTIYFVELKKWVKENIPESFIKSRGLDHDGSLASLAGHILAVSALNIESKFYPSAINVTLLMKELRVYSKDDTVRMKYIHDHKTEFIELAKRTKSLIIEKNKARSKISKLKNIKQFLEENKKLSIKQATTNVDKEIQELEKVVLKIVK